MRITSTVLLFLLLAGAAYAQVAEMGASVGVAKLTQSTLVPASTGVLETKLNSGFRFGFRVTLNTARFVGHEVGYAYSRTNLSYQGTNYGTATHQGFYDFLVYAIPEGSKVRPFIAGGGQFSNFMYPGYSVTSGGGGRMKFGINYGGGVKVKVAEKWLVRMDFRQYMSPKPDFDFTTAPKGWLRINEISAGFSYTL
jgi:opacity protein-like surface antigen